MGIKSEKITEALYRDNNSGNHFFAGDGFFEIKF